ncbi:MAG: site-specific integrase [Planctomycetaceae bacterium]|nr:site-specific integrase [Planctomycetaceae bacterium]
MEEYRRLLEACPCQDWRAIISLARIGGLRCPSEVITLRWKDVNWKKNCFYVRSSKTEQHEGKESRVVPIFPELKAELEALFSHPESKGQKFVINRYQNANQNLRTTLEKIVIRAGLPLFPRPFDNMRMTRSNEIYRKFGAFKESQWIGHSGKVRADHYLSITDDDYQEAAEWTD